jgi:hypothetical protein
MEDEHSDQNNTTLPSLGNSDSPPLRKIFVGNLSDKVSGLDLRRLFCLYGEVVEARVLKQRLTYVTKKYGFVTFKYPQDAINVLKLEPATLRLGSQNLFVAAADRQHQPVELPDGTVLWKPYPRRGGAQRDECKIDMLNDYCLMHVFSFLSMRERVKVERVCKRWQAASLASWVGMKHLDFKTAFRFSSVAVLNTHILKAGLKRCGRYLESLSLSRKFNSLGESALGTVASTCQRLRYLELVNVQVTSAGLRSLSAISHQLIALSLDGCRGLIDEDLENLFMQSPHLESVTLRNNIAVTGKCLCGLTQAPLRELVLADRSNLEGDYLLEVLPKLQGLKRLSLKTYSPVTDLITINVGSLIELVPNLQSFSIGYFPVFRHGTLTPLEQLSGLLSLDLHDNPFVNNETIETLTIFGHRIEELNISGCNFQSLETDIVTEDGYKCLSRLPNLVRLNVSVSWEVSDEVLEVIASRGKLQKLACSWCPSVTEVGCISVISVCKQLEHFNFQGCDVEPVTLLQATADIIKLRPNNRKLLAVMRDIENQIHSKGDVRFHEVNWYDALPMYQNHEQY